MSCVAVRDTTQIGCTPKDIFDHGQAMGIYSSLKSSVEDFLKYLDYQGAPVSFPDVKSYATWLQKKGYFKTSLVNYTNALQSWIN